jgi:hypothetical protein
MTSEISTFGFIGDGDTELPDLALELADLGLLTPVEALGGSVAALSRSLAGGAGRTGGGLDAPGVAVPHLGQTSPCAIHAPSLPSALPSARA